MLLTSTNYYTFKPGARWGSPLEFTAFAFHTQASGAPKIVIQMSPNNFPNFKFNVIVETSIVRFPLIR